MKKILFFSVPLILALVIAYSCTRSKSSASEIGRSKLSSASITQDPSDFSLEVGSSVPGDSGRAWMKAYLHGRAAESTPYVLHIADIKKLLAKDSCVGIIAYHGFDGTNWVVLPYGITAKGNIMRTDSVPGQFGNISWARAKEYVLAYQRMNPNAIEAHFFGSRIFSRMDHVLGVKDIRFQLGNNTRGEQLLMSDANVANPGEFEDASRPCPPYCPSSGGVAQLF